MDIPSAKRNAYNAWMRETGTYPNEAEKKLIDKALKKEMKRLIKHPFNYRPQCWKKEEFSITCTSCQWTDECFSKDKEKV